MHTRLLEDFFVLIITILLTLVRHRIQIRYQTNTSGAESGVNKHVQSLVSNEFISFACGRSFLIINYSNMYIVLVYL